MLAGVYQDATTVRGSHSGEAESFLCCLGPCFVVAVVDAEEKLSTFAKPSSRHRYAPRFPNQVICEPLNGDSSSLTINQKKFLFPKEFTVGQTVSIHTLTLSAPCQSRVSFD